MAKSITIDGVELAQLVIMKDPASGKILVQAAYHVKSGKDIIKTVPTRALTFAPMGQQVQQTPDLMTSQEQAYASAAWDSVVAALQRLEL